MCRETIHLLAYLRRMNESSLCRSMSTKVPPKPAEKAKQTQFPDPRLLRDYTIMSAERDAAEPKAFPRTARGRVLCWKWTRYNTGDERIEETSRVDQPARTLELCSHSKKERFAIAVNLKVFEVLSVALSRAQNATEAPRMSSANRPCLTPSAETRLKYAKPN